ncbi:MAG: DUF3847 domain-containing protein [Sporomusa sp.]
MATEKNETINTKIEKTKMEIRQLENRAKRLTQAHSQLERKARTRRLIQRGAILESFIPDAETMTNEQIQSILLAAFHTTAAIEALKKARDSVSTDSSLV